MKKIFPVAFIFLISLFLLPATVFACAVSISPSSVVVGGSANIKITTLYTGPYAIKFFLSGSQYQSQNYNFTASQPYPFSAPVTNTGNYEIKVESGVGIDSCSGVYTGTATSGGSGGNDALKNPPSGWLKNVNPGFTPPWGANFGLDFFTKQLVPFLVWAGIFFTIILSLAFLIIGGIMFSTAGGNKEGMAKAKATVTYAIVGLVLGLSSFIILAVLGNFFGVNLTGADPLRLERCRQLGIPLGQCP